MDPVFVFLVAVLAIFTCGLVIPITGYILKETEVSRLSSNGLRFAYPGELDLTLVAFHYSVNKAVSGVDAADWNYDVRSPTGDYWVHENTLINVEVGDVVNYWVYVLYQEQGFQQLGQSWTVIAPPPQPTNAPTTQSPATIQHPRQLSSTSPATNSPATNTSATNTPVLNKPGIGVEGVGESTSPNGTSTVTTTTTISIVITTVVVCAAVAVIATLVYKKRKPGIHVQRTGIPSESYTTSRPRLPLPRDHGRIGVEPHQAPAGTNLDDEGSITHIYHSIKAQGHPYGTENEAVSSSPDSEQNEDVYLEPLEVISTEDRDAGTQGHPEGTENEAVLSSADSEQNEDAYLEVISTEDRDEVNPGASFGILSTAERDSSYRSNAPTTNYTNATDVPPSDYDDFSCITFIRDEEEAQ